MDLNKFVRDELILGTVALLLAIDLLFLPWFELNFGFGSLSLSLSVTATDAPNGWLGAIGVIACLGLVADLVLERFTDARLPAIGGTRAATRLALAITAAACVAVKFLLNVHFDLFGFGFWAAAVLAVLLVVFARRLAI